MSLPIWVGIFGTIIAIAAILNGRNIVKKGDGTAIVLGSIHIGLAGLFLPVMWITIYAMVAG